MIIVDLPLQAPISRTYGTTGGSNPWKRNALACRAAWWRGARVVVIGASGEDAETCKKGLETHLCLHVGRDSSLGPKSALRNRLLSLLVFEGTTRESAP